jgi:hypothetical protein
MTFGKVSALVIGFLCAVGLGVWIGPYVTDQMALHRDADSAQVSEPSVAAPAPRPDRPAPRRAPARTVTPAPTATIAISAPELHAHLQPLLNKGADMTIASEGFRDAEQFATVAHASRNTAIPFMVLKHRVVIEGKTLAAAIRESKPDLDATSEATRARSEARADLAKLTG